MADTGRKDISIRAGIEPGAADAIAKEAEKALGAWQKRAKAVQTELRSAFQGAVSDMGRAVTVGNAISFARAVDSAREFRHSIGVLASTAGPVAQLRTQIGILSQTKIVREQDLIAADRSLGRMVYSTRGALGALGALADQAQATSETLGDKLPLGATLMGAMGVAGEKVGDELGRIRTLADALGTSGGLLAAEDRLTSMRDLLAEMGGQADKDRGKLEALALGLGNLPGVSAGRGAQIAGNILGTVSGRRETFEALAGMKLGSLTGKNGELNVDAAGEAMTRAQAWVKRQSKDKFMQQMIAASFFGGDRQAGAAFLAGDIPKMLAAGAAAGPSGKTAAEAQAYRNSDAGRYEASVQGMERTARQTGESLLPVADRAQALLAAHPFAGGAAMGAAGNLLGSMAGGFAGKIGETIIGAGKALLAGGKAGGAAVAAGGAAAGAALRAEKALSAAGGVVGKGGAVLGALGLGYTVGTYLDETLGISDSIESGVLSGGQANRHGADNAALASQVAASRAARARNRADKANSILRRMSTGAYDAKAAQDAAGGDVALQRLVGGVKSGAVNVAGLGADSVALITAAIERAKLNVKIENHSESPIAVNQQQAAGGLKN